MILLGGVPEFFQGLLPTPSKGCSTNASRVKTSSVAFESRYLRCNETNSLTFSKDNWL